MLTDRTISLPSEDGSTNLLLSVIYTMYAVTKPHKIEAAINSWLNNSHNSYKLLLAPGEWVAIVPKANLKGKREIVGTGKTLEEALAQAQLRVGEKKPLICRIPDYYRRVPQTTSHGDN